MNRQRRTSKEKGITLIALIITIVVLLILAVVAIRAVQGNGIIEYAKNAASNYEKGQDVEQKQLQKYLTTLNEETLVPGLYKEDGTFVSWEQLTSTEYKTLKYKVWNGSAYEEKTASILNVDENGVLYTAEDMDTSENISFEHLGKKLIIGDNVKEIGDYCFFCCDKIKTVVIPNIIKIGEMAFGSSSVETVILSGNNLSTIDAYAFEHCESLTSITLPGSVENILVGTFEACVNLSTINYKGTKAQWNTINLSPYWNIYCPEITVHCTDGKITIPAWND